ncbi:DUF3473 domain-containing protein [Candidatus Poribacteria bacterium]|nr:DUF3473 domain-containing protein [Candidatus Poribacteria bacterium]
MTGRICNMLTIDLEDWYHGIELPNCQWSNCKDRIEYSVDLLLKMLKEENTKATFFILGHVAERFPDLVREISLMGHEVGTHGYGHDFVYELTPGEFSDDLRRSMEILEDIVNYPVKIYRAPYFSITNKSTWAIDILTRHGIEYDSSVFPISNYRYGIPRARRYIHSIKTKNGIITEIPVSTVRAMGGNLAFTGGFYLRFFPYYVIKRAIKSINSEGYPAVVYLHPWELDPGHPRLELPLRIRLTHYHNLGSTETKLRNLLREFQFDTATNVADKTKPLECIECHQLSFDMIEV